MQIISPVSLQDRNWVSTNLSVPSHCEDAAGLQAQTLSNLRHQYHSPSLHYPHDQGSFYCIFHQPFDGSMFKMMFSRRVLYYIWYFLLYFGEKKKPTLSHYLVCKSPRTWWALALWALLLDSTWPPGPCSCSPGRSSENLLEESTWGR